MNPGSEANVVNTQIDTTATIQVMQMDNRMN